MNPRYGMVVDLNRCVGCQTCTAACKHANDTPPGVQWRRVLDVEQGTYPNVERVFLVVGCQHCADPPCVPVCPSGATKQRADGLVTMDYETCIGCAYCAVACPYQARTIVEEKKFYYGEPTRQELATYHDERIGVANKCTFCVDRIDEAETLGLTPGIDLEVTPACAAACIASAIQFGDFADPESNVSKLAAENQHFQMHADLGTDPQIKYLYEVPGATPGREADPTDLDDEHLSDPENPLVGPRQTWWDYKAAMNFALGGLASGLMVIACLFYFLGGISQFALVGLYLLGAVVMGIGLFFVFLKIKQKARFLNVLLRPASSWMTRETYCVGIIYPALLADLFWTHPILHGLIGLAAAGFLASQAMILKRARGIPAWRAPLVPWMLGVTGLLEGLGVLAFATSLMQPETVRQFTGPVGLWGALLALASGVLWHLYRATAKANGMPPLARRTIDQATPMVHGFAHATPLLLFVVAWNFSGSGIAALCLALGGTVAVAGGLVWKFDLITKAGYFQGFALPKMPTRGSGTRSAPVRLEAPKMAAE
jgi:phenylacetyl-CoA:acceptor oxidoreductase subunit 1